VSISSAGKGDDPRPVNKKKFDEAMDRIFGVRDPLDYQKDGPKKYRVEKSEGKPA